MNFFKCYCSNNPINRVGKIIGPTGPTGPAGPRGATGPTGATGNTGPSAIAPLAVYNVNINGTGKSYDVKIKNVIYRLSYSSADAVNLKLLSTGGGTILVDVRRFSCFNSSVEGQTLNNYNLTPTPVDIDSIIYSNSVETHQTRIRQQDPITKLWSLYDVNLFVSANGSRTTIWIYMIAENVDFIVV